MPIDVRMEQPGVLFSDTAEDGPPLTRREKRLRRQALFSESSGVAAVRWGRAILRALTPSRIAQAPAGLSFIVSARSTPTGGLPEPASALAKPDGLCGLVTDERPETLLEGFARGMFLAADCGPLKWWSPATRTALRPASCKLTREARRLLRREDLRFALDVNFDVAIAAHARQHWGWRSGRLIAPKLLSALAGLGDLGYAHSIEARDETGARVAGAFGVAVGRVFVTIGAHGRDQAHADAALIVLNRHLRAREFVLHDFVGDSDLSRLGFEPMPRARFLSILAANSNPGPAERWRVDPALCKRNMPTAPGEARDEADDASEAAEAA